MKAKVVIYIPTGSHEEENVLFHPFLGVPLFMRGMMTLSEVGFSDFVIVTPGQHRKQILKGWRHIVGDKPLNFHLIQTAVSKVITKNDIEEILQVTDESFIMLKASLIVTKGGAGDIARIMSTDEPYPVVISTYNDSCAAVKLKKIALTSIKDHAVTTPLTMGKLIDEYLSSAEHHIQPLKPQCGINVKYSGDLRRARNILTEDIRLSTQGPIAKVLNKRISLPISVFLSEYRVSPNSITVFNMCLGLLSGVAAAGKTYFAMALAGILFQLASVIDGCDGEVAKLTYRQSKFGQYIDSVSDNSALLAIFIGITIHCWRIGGSTTPFIWGGALALGLLVIFFVMIRFLKRNSDSASFVTFDNEYLQKLPATTPQLVLAIIRYGKIFLRKDVFSFAIMVLGILGILDWMLYLSVVGTWVASGVLIYLQIRYPR